MKIIASRRDDILRRKEEYEAAEARNKAKEDEMYNRYSKAQEDVFSGVEAGIRRQLGDKIGELNIHIDTRYRNLVVEISNNDGSPRRSPNASLSWTWRAMLDEEGKVKKESSSWSGLEATTLEQIQDLKVCVEQLEIINTMDWEHLLDVTLPNWRDYQVTDLEDIGPKPNFNQELFEADLEDAIGQRVLVEAKEGRDYRGGVYFQILRDSGSQYTVVEIPRTYIQDVQNGKPVRLSYNGNEVNTIADVVNYFSGYTKRIRKANFINMVVRPIRTINF